MTNNKRLRFFKVLENDGVKETFLDIKGYERLYYASTEGKIYSTRSEKIIKTRKDKDGYELIDLYDNNGSVKTFRLHRLILDTFSDLDSNLEVDHIDKVINNYDEVNGNRLSNLEAVTKLENLKRKNENYEYKHTDKFEITLKNYEFYKKFAEE